MVASARRVSVEVCVCFHSYCRPTQLVYGCHSSPPSTRLEICTSSLPPHLPHSSTHLPHSSLCRATGVLRRRTPGVHPGLLHTPPPPLLSLPGRLHRETASRERRLAGGRSRSHCQRFASPLFPAKPSITLTQSILLHQLLRTMRSCRPPTSLMSSQQQSTVS